MLFGRRKPTPLPEASRMGFRSRLVLEKLGFDLRQRYDALLGRELPDELGRLASKLNQALSNWERSRYSEAVVGPVIGVAPVERCDSSAVACFDHLRDNRPEIPRRLSQTRCEHCSGAETLNCNPPARCW